MTSGGVVQYDMGKATLGGFEQTGMLNKPPVALQAAAQQLIATHEMAESQVTTYLSQMLAQVSKMQEKYIRPLAGDQLFAASYDHQGGTTCAGCDVASAIDRPYRASSEPVIHYGTIGSANRVVKNAVERDKLKAGGQDILCVEMEAAGLMDSFPCLVIRGICDYADSHKNKQWQPYAAAVAAAYMKPWRNVCTPVNRWYLG
jgi:nucleoside phosphorylase